MFLIIFFHVYLLFYSNTPASYDRTTTSKEQSATCRITAISPYNTCSSLQKNPHRYLNPIQREVRTEVRMYLIKLPFLKHAHECRMHTLDIFLQQKVTQKNLKQIKVLQASQMSLFAVLCNRKLSLSIDKQVSQAQRRHVKNFMHARYNCISGTTPNILIQAGHLRWTLSTLSICYASRITCQFLAT